MKPRPIAGIAPHSLTVAGWNSPSPASSAIIAAGAPSSSKPSAWAILVWDPAGIDFGLWRELKQGHGIYFISRTKENPSGMRRTNRLREGLPHSVATFWALRALFSDFMLSLLHCLVGDISFPASFNSRFRARASLSRLRTSRPDTEVELLCCLRVVLLMPWKVVQCPMLLKIN